MDDQTSGEVTLLLQRWQSGNQEARRDLFSLVYSELRRIARAKLAQERSDHTLQPTALVHEAFLKLAGSNELGAADRDHFLAIAAQAMRRVLVDHARKKRAKKRFRSDKKVSLDKQDLPIESSPEQILAIHQALGELEKHHPRKARLVELRYFGGLAESEIASILSLSRATITRDWRFARVWLYERLSPTAG